MLDPGSLRSVPIMDIELDVENPRIRKWLEMYPDPTPDQIYLALGSGSDDESESSTTFEKLKQSIITNGGVILPVILNETSDGRIVCIEGNTRVAIYRDFLAQKRPGNWDSIPALVHKNLDRGGIEAVRLQVHLVPPRGWEPYAKAKYLSHLRDHEHLPFSEIMDYAGGRQKEVYEAINAYADMEHYYRDVVPDDGSFDTKKFSGFVELQKPGIKEAILSANFTLHDFARWVFEEKVYPLNTVRMLPRILKNEEARKVFLKEGARKAAMVLEKPDLSKTLMDADVTQIARALNIKILKMPFAEMQSLRQDPGGDAAQELVQALENLQGLLEQLDLTPAPN